MLIDSMAWEKPEHSVSQVKRAGIIHMDPAASADDKARALLIINNWRDCHQYPLNVITDALRKKARKLEPKGLVVQRNKRLPAIEEKLERETIKLNQMQDIGGCRAIVATVNQVRELVKAYNKKGAGVKITDYIAKPRKTGYRGVHIIHKFSSKVHPAYNGLQIEMQIRTRKQHLWSTAVETVGYYINQPLKANKGNPDWLRFFQLMSGAIAFQEKAPLPDGLPTERKQLLKELADITAKIDVYNAFMMYGTAAKHLTDKKLTRGDVHFVLKLNAKKRTMDIDGFKEDQIRQAQEKLREEEAKKLPDVNVVLASANSYAALKKAYPNYFLETEKFLELLRATLNQS